MTSKKKLKRMSNAELSRREQEQRAQRAFEALARVVKAYPELGPLENQSQSDESEVH